MSEHLGQRLQENSLTSTHPEITAKLISASGAIRELAELEDRPRVHDLDTLLSRVALPTDPFDRIDRLLLSILRHTTSSAEYVVIDPAVDFPIAYARSGEELTFLLRKACRIGYLESSGETPERYRLDLEGWQRIREIRKSTRNSRHAFVAMWFDERMDDAFRLGFGPALVDTGYEPIRIDQEEHNEKIDDRIIAEIRRSGLLVADFTGNRGGVYFEAGFAMGIGIPVIWCCKHSDIEAVHFDTRQYNHIVWKDPADLKEKLVFRIEATLAQLRVPNLGGRM